MERHFPTDRMSERSVLRLLRSPSAFLWVATLEGAVCATLVVLARRDGRRARIYSVVVDEVARGQGLAKRMVRVAERWARADGRAEVSLEVRNDNLPARRLYETLGYRVDERLRDYYEDHGSGLRLRKRFARND
jgi:ribosomal-protein-alanine N-acetyltransferase